MSGQNIIIAVIVAIALGAGVWWIVSDPVGEAVKTAVDEAPEVTREPARETDDEVMPSGTGRLMELYEQGVPMECTFTYSDEMGSGEGTSYFDGEQMRVSAMHEEGGMTLVSNVINDGMYMYVWGESQEGDFEGDFAVRMEATEESMMEHEDGLDETTAFNEEVDYDCREWSIDPSVFNPPADIEFMDMGGMMEGAMQGAPDMDIPSIEEMEGMSPEELDAMMEDMMQGAPQ